MFSLALHWIWNWLFGWGGISLLVAIGAAAVWWFIPVVFTKVKALAFNVAIGALAFNSVYTMGYQNGASGVRAEWLAAEQRAVNGGTDARTSAEREIPAVVDAPALAECPEPAATPPVAGRPIPVPRRPVPQWMRNDRNNRDNH